MRDDRHVGAWELWANPILRRYCRSRLRLRHLVPWALIVLIVTLFIVFLLFTISRRMDSLTWEEAARTALVPLVIIQMLLLMFVGTGSVAAGVARESIDGMVDYQRLTPMTPLAKTLGYLFGLPVREYVLTGLTMPFVVYCGVVGKVSWEPAIKFYSVFFTSVVLYHLTGLVAGSIVKRKFLAGRTAQFLVAGLYLLAPRFAGLGFIFLVYLTVLPAWGAHLLPLLKGQPLGGLLIGFQGEVPWFQWSFSPTAFSLLIQGVLIFLFVVVLGRKWRDPDADILGHGFSLVVFAGFLALVLGNALPLMEDGSFFNIPQKTFGGLPRDFQDEGYGWLTVGMIGVALFLWILLLMHIITPIRHAALRGFRRARKLGHRRVDLFSDDQTSVGHGLILVIMGVVGWMLFARGIASSAVFEDIDLAWYQWILQGAALAFPLLCYHLVLEWRGWRTGLILMLVFWAMPPLAGIVLGASGRFEVAALVTAALSGPLLPIYAVALGGLEAQEPSEGVETFAHRVRLAFWISTLFYAALYPYLFVQWKGYRQRLRMLAEVSDGEPTSTAAPRPDPS